MAADFHAAGKQGDAGRGRYGQYAALLDGVVLQILVRD